MIAMATATTETPTTVNLPGTIARVAQEILVDLLADLQAARGAVQVCDIGASFHPPVSLANMHLIGWGCQTYNDCADPLNCNNGVCG